MLDEIVWRHYGRQDQGLVELVLRDNPGLADLGPVLPVNTPVMLCQVAAPEPVAPVRLWS